MAGERTVGAVAAELFVAHGIDKLFLLTGGDNAFFMELRDRGVDVVLARSERSAAFMADAHARLTGRPAFVYGQFGPGAMVALSGIIDSLYGRSPVVTLASETNQGVYNRFAYQELDQVALYGAVTKWAARVERADRLPDMFRTAVREAMSGMPGPTYLGVPTDLLLAPADPASEVYAESRVLEMPGHRTRPATEEIEAVARAVEAAERPVVVAGTGVLSSRAWEELTAFAERFSIPVATSAGGKGAIAETHPLAVGVSGRYSRVSANQVVRGADLVLAIGTRLNDMTTDRHRTIRPEVPIAHLDADPGALGRTIAERVGAVGDAKLSILDLGEALSARQSWTKWAAEATALTVAWKERRAQVETESVAGAISPVATIGALREVLGPRDVVVSDTGHAAAWTAALYDLELPGLQHLRTAGSLGWSLPASLGAQLARPDDRVVCVIGDGGIGYHLADIETAVRRRLPVVFVLLNNGTLGFEYEVQRRLLGRVDSSFIDFVDTDYVTTARGLGAGARRVTAPDELVSALREALDDGGPYLLDVATDREARAPVTNFDHLEERLI